MRFGSCWNSPCATLNQKQDGEVFDGERRAFKKSCKNLPSEKGGLGCFFFFFFCCLLFFCFFVFFPPSCNHSHFINSTDFSNHVGNQMAKSNVTGLTPVFFLKKNNV